MLRIILIRHGQTEWSSWGTHGGHFCGRIDIKLNATGIVQAQAIAQCLTALQVDAVYTSPLRRSSNTAVLIAQAHRLKANPLPGLLDINYGQWNGRSVKEVAARWPDLYEQWKSAPHLVRVPDGESLDDVRRRVDVVLGEIIGRHDQQSIVIVGHETLNKVMICKMIGLGNSAFWRIRQDVGCINRLDYDGSDFTLLTLNEVSHLPAQPQDLTELA